MPIGIKDIIDVAGMPTTMGAAAFAHRRPGADAAAVARLRAAGAVIVGKTVATQFAFKDPAPTTNPWSVEHTPGGSSSGSAAAVAARQVPAAIGTQTVGSILRPSAFCGVVGLKGAHGAVPIDGVLPLAPTLDHGGPDRAVRGRRGARAGGDRRGARRPRTVGTPRLAVAPGLFALAEPAARAHLDGMIGRLADAGGEVAEVVLPASFAQLGDAGRVILEAEAAGVHEAMFREHAAEYGPQIAALVARGPRARPTSSSGPDRPGGVPRVRRRDARGRRRPAVAGRAGTRAAARDGTGDFALCAPWSTAGVPSIAIPTGLDEAGLPLALQLTGAPGGLDRLLGAAAWCEVRIDFDARPRRSPRDDAAVGPIGCLAGARHRGPRDQLARGGRRLPRAGSRTSTRGSTRSSGWPTTRGTGRDGPTRSSMPVPRSGRSTACRSRSRTRSTRRASSRPPAPSGWRDRVPGRDATVVARLRAAGGILLGKTNTPEFTWANETDNEVYGRTSNPYDLGRTTGGSSGGSAAIVAAGGAPFDIGSDSGNSIRQPAHLCGVAGIKPTSGRVPRTRHWPGYEGLFESFTQLGPIARRVEDLELVLPIIAGPDGEDPHVVPAPLGDPGKVDVGRLRVAWFDDNGIRTPTPETIAAVRPASARSRRPGPPSRSRCRPTSPMRGRPGRRSSARTGSPGCGA